MKASVDIIVLESDKTQVDEIKRFLKPGSDSFQYSLKSIDTIADLSKIKQSSAIGAFLVNADLVKDNNDFDTFNKFIQQQQVPVVLFSSAMNAEVKQKAVQLNASDFVLNNKLNLFHLPKTLESALKLNQQKNTVTANIPTNYNLFDNIQQPVLVFESTKPIYYNSKALHLLNEETLLQLKQFLPLTLKTFELTLKGHEYTVQKTDKDGHTILFVNPTPETGTDMLVGISKIVDHAPFLIFKNDHLVFFNQKANQTLVDIDLYSTFDQLFTLNTDASNPLIIHRSSKVNFGFNIETMAIAGKDYQLLILHDAKEERIEKFPMGKLINAFSHDLKEPVRTSLSYIQLLERKVNKESAEYVSIISTEMKRMDSLLQNMKMALSTDDEGVQLNPVNVRIVLESVFKQLKPLIDNADAMIDLSTMPEVQADQKKLTIVFTHLIENALKFRRKDKRCFIEILADVKPNETIFCVKDNGIGIEQKYHQEIFQPFYRLISFDENPANGLGLYISKTIVEQHKGRIWVESREGFGTSAFFTIPR